MLHEGFTCDSPAGITHTDELRLIMAFGVWDQSMVIFAVHCEIQLLISWRLIGWSIILTPLRLFLLAVCACVCVWLFLFPVTSYSGSGSFFTPDVFVLLSVHVVLT